MSEAPPSGIALRLAFGAVYENCERIALAFVNRLTVFVPCELTRLRASSNGGKRDQLA
jgi:hypothetical protein